MYVSPNLFGGGWCFAHASKNSMLLASAHIFSPPPITMHENPFLPSRSVVIFPSFSMRTTAAALAPASAAADRPRALYSASEGPDYWAETRQAMRMSKSGTANPVLHVGI